MSVDEPVAAGVFVLRTLRRSDASFSLAHGVADRQRSNGRRTTRLAGAVEPTGTCGRSEKISRCRQERSGFGPRSARWRRLADNGLCPVADGLDFEGVA